MRKKYVTDVVGKEYLRWGRGDTVFLKFPTGYGKTWFIVSVYLSHIQSAGKKVLILCNRKLLRSQYWFDLVQKFDSYNELETVVRVETYQALYTQYRKEEGITKVLAEFDAVVFDEVHYFISDSDFNGGGTFLLFQALIEETIFKTKIFISATPDIIEPIIRVSIKNCITRFKKMSDVPSSYDSLMEYFPYNSRENDVCHLDCWEVPDVPTLHRLIAESNHKSIIFIDSKDKAEQWKGDLICKHKVKEQDIVLLNSENIDSNSEFVMRLASAHLLDAKILITTCVLDNGVSIHDPEVGNLAILTDDPISFKQMVGRIRTEHSNHINMYFLTRSSKEFERRMNQAKRELEKIKPFKEGISKFAQRPSRIINDVWEEAEDFSFYKKYFVVSRSEQRIYSNPEPNVRGYYGDVKILLNEFAIDKLKQAYLYESRLHALALQSPTKAIQEQMKWLGIEPTCLKSISSSYIDDRIKQMMTFLLSVKAYSSEEFQKMKQQLVKDFNDLIEFDTRNGSISNEKMRQLCDSYNLVFDIDVGDDRKNRYWIRRKDDNEQ